MNPPGWYPDPAGTPHTYRWWDGQAWTTSTTQTPTTTPPPADGGMPAAPGGGAPAGKTKKVLIGIGIGVVAIALVVTGIVVIPRLGGDPEEPPATAMPTDQGTAGGPQPSAQPTGSTGPVELNCAGGNQRTTGSQSPIYSSGGLQYEAPEDWGFRFDLSQWTWLDDQAVWGTTDIEPAEEDWAAGVALGGVQAANGFTDPETATENLIKCFLRYGFANDGSWEATKESSEEVTVGEMKGHRAVYLVSDGSNASYPGYQVVALVLDTGRDGSFGSWMSFGPKGESTTSAQIEAAEKSITGN